MIVKTFLRYLVFGLSLAAFSEAALGQTVAGPTVLCSDVILQYNFCVAQGALCNPTFYTQRYPQCFGQSSTAAAAQSVQATSFQQMLTISSALSARASARFTPPGALNKSPSALNDSGLLKGLAGGDTVQQWNAWGSVSKNTAKFDRGSISGTASTNKFDSDIQNLVLGGDYQMTPTLAVGLSLAFDNGSGSAFSTTAGTKPVSTSGSGYAPYIGWQISKELALDAQMGWGSGKSTVDGTNQTDLKRFFYGANLGYTSWYGNWQLTGRGSYLFGEERSGDVVASGTVATNSAVTNKSGQFRLGGQAGYWMNGFMPYFGLAYVADQRSSSASAAEQDATDMGKNALLWSLGANIISQSNLTGGIVYEQETGRDRSKNNQLMVNINYRF